MELKEEASKYMAEMQNRGISLYRVANMSVEELKDYMSVSDELAKEIIELAKREAEEKMRKKKKKGNPLTMLPHVGKKRSEEMKKRGLSIEKIAEMKPSELSKIVPHLSRKEAEDIIFAAELKMEEELAKNEKREDLYKLPYIGVRRAYLLRRKGMSIEKISEMKPRELMELIPDIDRTQAEEIITSAELIVESKESELKTVEKNDEMLKNLNWRLKHRTKARRPVVTKKSMEYKHPRTLPHLRHGMVNGNSLINGRGVINGLSLQHRAPPQRKSAYLLVLIIVVSAVAPMLFLSATHHGITIDGNFQDWSGVPDVRNPYSSEMIEDAKYVCTSHEIFVYIHTSSDIFSSPQGFYIFIDSDHNRSTGYYAGGVGAEYMVKVIGWNDKTEESEVYIYKGTTNYNWSAFSSFGTVPIAYRGKYMELGVPIHSQNPVLSVFAKNGGYEDSLHIPLFKKGVYVYVKNAGVVNGKNAEIVNIYTASRTALTIHAIPFGNLTSLRYQYGIYEPHGSDFTQIGTDCSNLTVNGNRSIYILYSANGSGTLGFKVRVEGEGVNVYNNVQSVAFGNPKMCVDGNFSDWNDVDGKKDPADDLEPNSNYTHTNIDLLTVKRRNSYFYIRTAGPILAGDVVPEIVEKRLKDSDGDGVPDIYDLYPHDFNNDGIPDNESYVIVNGEKLPDVDGDGIADYPYGPDMWLNTTIPDDFPKPYAGREVHRYIGPVPHLPVTGNDTFMIFIDDGGDYSAPFLPFKSGYMVEITGRGFNGTAYLMKFEAGRWVRVRGVDIAFAGDELEGNSIISGRIFVLSEDWLGQRDLEDFTRSGNITIAKLNMSAPPVRAAGEDATYVNQTFEWSGNMSFGNLTLINCTIYVHGWLNLSISGNFYMDNKTIIYANGTGLSGGSGGTSSDKNGEAGTGSGAGDGGYYNGGGGGGGGYGGAGGDGGGNGGAGGATYGTNDGWDITVGSGGGGGAYYYTTWWGIPITANGGSGGTGGGCVKIIAGGKVDVEGEINVSGEDGAIGGGGGGGGSGGGVLIFGHDVILNGSIIATGGDGGPGVKSAGGGGGGGRIKIFYVENLIVNGILNVSGGKTGSIGSSGGDGSAGTTNFSKVPELPIIEWPIILIIIVVLGIRRKHR